ncbi:MAG TPA: carboxypeptidase-like regulatory domain-containing protein, partial [Saprospiraceae bacterium]|nr:carboxypeptidase-like regulatory domain-containing protein [Saprospiraceae bacterium]
MRFFLLLLCALFSLSLSAQVALSGQVTDAATGEPLVGATVAVKGTPKGTSTDVDGRFRLQVDNGQAVLSISYSGYVTQKLTVGGQRDFSIKLSEDQQLLDEVVVVGYGTQKRSSISGAVASITSEEVAELPVLRTEQALQGRVAGITVTQNSGSPGSALSVRVRGTGSINGSEPLYIVDGVPVDGLDFLNPQDIESINVLKDGASAAIYGSRGANGVVLITTRSGKKEQDGRISYDAYYGMQSPWKTANLLSAREYAILSNEAHVAAGVTPLPEFANPDALGEGTNWLDAIFSDAPMSSHQITFSGSSGKSSYSLSGNAFNQQ